MRVDDADGSLPSTRRRHGSSTDSTRQPSMGGESAGRREQTVEGAGPRSGLPRGPRDGAGESERRRCRAEWTRERVRAATGGER